MELQYALLVLVFILSAGFAAYGFRLRAKALSAYWRRSCTGRDWKARFPAASNDEIRTFLNDFVDAFGFPPRSALCFSPTDPVLGIYRAACPPQIGIDNLELETLSDRLKRTYGFELRDIWSESTTLGDVFASARKQ